MLRRICRIRSGGEAIEALAPYLESQAESIVLAPTRAAADELLFATAGSIGAHRLTLNQLALEAAAPELATRGLTPVSGLMGEAIVSRAIHQLRRGRKLAYFAPVADTPGFPQAAIRTIRELRLERITPAKLARGGLAERDLGLLLRAWVRLLDEFSLADEAAIFELAAAAASPLRGLPVLALDVPLRSRAEKEFLRAFLEPSPMVVAVVSDGDRESEPAWRRLLGVPSEEARGGGPTQLHTLRERLFQVGGSNVPEDGSVEFFSSPGEGAECVEIARRVLAHANAGVAFDRMAILLRQPERYQALVEDALRRAGAPAYFSRGVRRPDPAGRAFLTLLECAVERLSASRFAEYLSLAQTPYRDAENLYVSPGGALGIESTPVPEPPALARTPPAPANWERLLVEAAVIGGADRWRRRLDGLAAETRLLLEAAEDEGRRAYLIRQADQLEHLCSFALPLIEELDLLPESATWDQWLPRLENLARAALRHPYGVLTLLAELRPLGDVGPVGLTEVRDVLTPQLSTLRLEPSVRRFGAVLVASIEEARGRAFDVAFVPGLAEGLFPRKIVEDPLLLDSARERLDLELARRETHTARERTLLEIASGAAARVVFSYPTMDTSLGRGRVPSLYALEVERAARGSVASLDKFERSWRESASARLGWPAPEDPRDAIDESEFDLAVLGGIRYDAPVAEVKGRLSFLAANPHALRALRARHRRWETKGKWTMSDGLWEPDERVLTALAGLSLTKTAYSPTALERWAACPYRFYLHAILHLRERESPEAVERLDPRTRGQIFHDVQFRTLSALREEGALPVTRASFPQALAVAERELAAAAAAFEERLAPAIPAVWLAEMESIRTDLRGWLYEIAGDQGRWIPEHFEFRFGLAGEAHPEAVIGGGFRLRGAIDLIEREAATGALRVVDHKTGRPADLAGILAVGRGETLQPALYAMAAESLLGAKVLSGELFHCTNAGGYRRFGVPMNDLVRDRVNRVLEAIDATVSRGLLPAAPRRDACSGCDYIAVCGPGEQRRTAHKPVEKFKELVEVRSLA
jgi:ATP-dependent helicase/nuclease subunit B